MSEIIECFRQFNGKKIALYGLGNETARVLGELDKHFEIIGLLDSFKEDGEIIYGLPVISLSRAIEAGAMLIIVVARPGSCKAIAKKIGDRCKTHHVALYDIRGKDLLAENKVIYDFSNLKGITREELLELSEKAEVISFDMFDTIGMRRTYEPTDLIELTYARLKEQGIDIKDFCFLRLASEKDLSKTYAPSLVDIYRNVIHKSRQDGLTDEITAEYLADVEWKIDYEMLVPRHNVVEVFHTIMRRNKHVYVVSDTYYSKKQISLMLNKCGIKEYTDILPSCEFKTNKTQKLFEVLKAKEIGKKILHIGDDPVADIESAHDNGIDTVRLYSGHDLMERLGYLGLDKYIDSLSDKIRVGMFIANLLNSPFQFESEEKRIIVANSYDIGFLFCAPVFCDFVHWFRSRIEEEGICNIWFGARDGYLIQKMYGLLLSVQSQENNSTYFLTSRVAAIRAGVRNEDDIRYVDSMKYHGTLEENLKERFGIKSEEIAEVNINRGGDGLLRYTKSILNNAELEKVNYQKYIEKLGIKAGGIAFFDFVAKGTSQIYLQRLVDNRLKGLYFLRLEPEGKMCGSLEVESFYKAEEADSSAIFNLYYILETLLTAPHPSVVAFNDMGEPIYTEETRSNRDIACFSRAQRGILDYLNIYIKLCPMKEWKENKKLDEVFLGLIQGVEIKDADFMNLVVEDRFFNRNTNITDVL